MTDEEYKEWLEEMGYGNPPVQNQGATAAAAAERGYYGAQDINAKIEISSNQPGGTKVLLES